MPRLTENGKGNRVSYLFIWQSVGFPDLYVSSFGLEGTIHGYSAIKEKIVSFLFYWIVTTGNVFCK